jgi:hypothetical protein
LIAALARWYFPELSVGAVSLPWFDSIDLRIGLLKQYIDLQIMDIDRRAVAEG